MGVAVGSGVAVGKGVFVAKGMADAVGMMVGSGAGVVQEERVNTIRKSMEMD